MQKERFRDDLGSHEWPSEAHAPIHGSSIQLGQFALLVKKGNTHENDSNAFTCTEENPTTNIATTTTSTSSSSQAYSSSSNDTRHGNQGNDMDGSRKRPNPSILHDKNAASATQHNKGKTKVWPALLSDDWCPPGTSIVTLNKGSIHSCSDKLCRWNYLGLQGSLLSSMLESPLFLSTLTVGRKFTECICRRAVCCRLVRPETEKRNRKRTDHTKLRQEQPPKEQNGQSTISAQTVPTIPTYMRRSSYQLNHPAILGTSVLLHEGAVETQIDTIGQDVRFHSSLCWAWWPSSSSSSCCPPLNHISAEPPTSDNDDTGIECIDGATGFSVMPHDYNNSPFEKSTTDSHHETLSPISTYALAKLFLETCALAQHRQETTTTAEEEEDYDALRGKLGTLKGLRQWKSLVSPEYEVTKKNLFGTHVVLKQWKRRMPES
jgi:Adenosine-deaminase (editase) domain